MKRKYFFALLSFTLLAVLSCFAYAADASSDFDKLFANYEAKEAGIAQAAELLEDLKRESGLSDLTEIELWQMLNNSPDMRKKAAAGVALQGKIFADGNLSRYDEVQGFYLPLDIPKPLVAADAVLITVCALQQMGGDGAKWLAHKIFSDFMRSEGARYHWGRIQPVALAQAIEALKKEGVGSWPSHLEIKGILPAASRINGSISDGRAMELGMTFLDGAGRPTAGAGSFAYDRVHGRIYKVVDPREWWLFGN